METDPPRVVFDTMVMFQWATLPPERWHGTDRAAKEGSVAQCLAPELLEEIRGLLNRPIVRAKYAGIITTERTAAFMDIVRKRSMWIDPVPSVFFFPAHPKDDHLFNLAIAARADLLVTWETRLLGLERKHPDVAARLRALAPGLRIVNPPRLMTELRLRQTDPGTSPGSQ